MAQTAEQADRLRVSTGDGKYEVVQEASGALYANRYGERWRELTGDNLIGAFGEAERETRRLARLLRRLGYEVRRPHPNAQELRIRVREGKAVADLAAAPSPNGLWEALPCPGQNKTQARALARVLRTGWLDRLRADLDRILAGQKEV